MKLMRTFIVLAGLAALLGFQVLISEQAGWDFIGHRLAGPDSIPTIQG